MNVKQIITGVLSGYVSKAIQLAASLVIVPFLLDPEIMGVAEYGRAFAILGATSLIGIATVGIHLAAERSIAQAIGRSSTDPGPMVGEVLGSATKVLFMLNVALTFPVVALSTHVLGWIGIPSDPAYRLALLAACSISIFENSLYLFRAPLIARGDIAFVNLVGMLEITGRTAAVFLVFTFSSATISTFLGLQALFTLARQIAFLARLRRSDLAGFARAHPSRSIEAIRYAGHVSLAEGSMIVVRSVPVMISSRFLGATEAGYVALVVNTLQGYFLQIFYAVVQPIAVPIASRFAFDEVSASQRRWFCEIEAAYNLTVGIVFAQLISWTPLIIPAWLGDEFAAIVPATQIALAGCGIQTAAIIRRSMLVGQGNIPAAVPALLATALASVLCVVGGVVIFDSWMAAIAFSSGYLVASTGLGIDRVFARRFGQDAITSPIPRLLSFSLVFAAAWCFGELTKGRSVPWQFVVLLSGLATTTALSFATIISIKRAIRLAQHLYRAQSTNLFG